MYNLLERLKICWYALTKKHYAFYAVDNMSVGHSNAKCFISDNRKDILCVFLGSINDYNNKLI